MENVEDAGIFICTNTLNQTWVEYGKKNKQTFLFALLYINYESVLWPSSAQSFGFLGGHLIAFVSISCPKLCAVRGCHLGEGQKTPSCPQIKNKPYDFTKVVAVFSKAFVLLIQAKPNRFVRVIGPWNAPLMAMPAFGPYHLYAKLFHEWIGFAFFSKSCFIELSFQKAKWCSLS